MSRGDLPQVLRLARMHFLVPGLLLYTLGSLLASARGYPLAWDRFLLGYAIFFLAHLSVSFSNDYFDREGDAMSNRTPLSGGSGVLVAHPELASLSLGIALSLLLASGVVATTFALAYGYQPLFVAFALAGGWLGWFYSAPPLRFAYRGLGEATTALAAGLVMPGMGYFVVSGSIDLWFLALSLPLMCYGLFFILTVEMPDVEADSLSGKRGYLVKHGRRGGARLSVSACALGTLLLLSLDLTGALGRDLDVGAISLISLIPLAAAASALRGTMGERQSVIRQAKLNFASMMGFLLLVNALLALGAI